MGTNYYARIIPSEKDKQKLIDAINNDKFDVIENIASEMYGSRSKYTGKGSVIHLGKRSRGWKFLWNPNVIKVWDNDGEYTHNYVYPLTKEGITNFVMREDVIITDEYNEVQNPKEFLEMAFNWCKDGLDGKKYQPKYNVIPYYPDKKNDEFWRNLGYKPEYYDFYSDGLRFSTCVEFL